MSFASQVRAGTEITQEDLDGLTKALQTEEGMRKYKAILSQADSTLDSHERDALLYNSLHFWKGQYFKKGRNVFTAAFQNRRPLCDEVMIEDEDGCRPSSFADLHSDHLPGSATSLYDPEARNESAKRDGRISDHTATRSIVGYLNSSDCISDPSESIGSSILIRMIMDSCSKEGILSHLLLLLNHWKIEVPTFVEMSRKERTIWKGIQSAQEVTEGSRRNNIRSVSESYGIPNFVTKRVTAKIVEAISIHTNIPKGKISKLLGGGISV